MVTVFQTTRAPTMHYGMHRHSESSEARCVHYQTDASLPTDGAVRGGFFEEVRRSNEPEGIEMLALFA